MKLVLMINKVDINDLCRGYLCLILYVGTTAGTSHTTVSTPGGYQHFPVYVAKILYIAKQVKPEYLTAVSS